MRFLDYLTRDRIILDLEATEKEKVLREIVGVLKKREVIPDEEPYYTALIERERLCSTGIGRGTAIPHAKLKEIDKIILTFARSKPGVEFDALDKNPVHFIFLILTPEDVPEDYLVLLARISRLAKDEEFKKVVMQASSEDEILKIFEEKDKEFEKKDIG
ncbi:PTS system, fructose-specific IIA component [Thermosulfidibacter takaii ABI70S6]|uniref:PTS system, fructose-specific IIA component n=1 Tax=Thermosulfidibacter takaii (strain DSM 17441 / JCM 13301 / NBRC 103674 / ABI70S6) TaxID=1298851 RepID=A0A0S3QSF1_THET7|nr:PTS sugar transporter subunit IIA [Thermosulfidibacter takaii]BAT71253.1 PTS system, fructose-specific IIA component [Thermosulfidibacter takaii ABI70S6]